MKRWALLAAIMMLSVSINAQPTLHEQAIGYCTVNSLRIRSQPSLDSDIIGSIGLNEEVFVYGRGNKRVIIDSINSYWYMVFTIYGVNGWCFGGYIDINGKEIIEYEPEAYEVRCKVDDLSASIGEGNICSLLTIVEKDFEIIRILFLKHNGKAPQIVFSRINNRDEDADTSINEILFKDIQGDETKEICAFFEDSLGDFSQGYLGIYARNIENGRYSYLGKILTTSSSGGGGMGSSSGTSLVSGPTMINIGKLKYIQIVKNDSSTSVISSSDGKPEKYIIRMRKYEEIYEINIAGIILFKSNDLDSNTYEQDYSK